MKPLISKVQSTDDPSKGLEPPVKRDISDGADVLGLFTLATGRNVELDALTLFERTVAVALNRGEVNEDVVAALTRDEAETLVGVEPLDGAGCHDVLLVSVAVCIRA